MNTINPYKKQQHKLSPAEMAKIVADTTPINDRLRATYLPMVAQDCALRLCEDLVATFISRGRSTTKKCCRELKSASTEYNLAIAKAMGPQLYEYFKEQSKQQYEKIATDMVIYQLSFSQALLDKHVNAEPTMRQLVCKMYVIRRIIEYTLQLDRDFSKKLSDLLPLDIHYTTDDNECCVRIEKALKDLTILLGYPADLSSVNIELSYKVFNNRIMSITAFDVEPTDENYKLHRAAGRCTCQHCALRHQLQISKDKKSAKCPTANKSVKSLCVWRKCSFYKFGE